MKRTERTPVIILSTSPSGERNRLLQLWTPEFGVIRAMAFGARSPKGKLQSSTSSMMAGMCTISHDPVKDLNRVTEMDVRNSYAGIREDIERFYTASLWAELVINMPHSPEEGEQAFMLGIDCFRMLDTATGRSIRQLSMFFLWRFIELHGLAPDVEYYTDSGQPIKGGAYYISGSQGLVSPLFAADRTNLISDSCLSVLRSWRGLKMLPKGSQTPELPELVLHEGLRFLYRYYQDILQKPLKTLQAGKGIL